ncbi:MBG domain-containing protein [Fibrobacter succinogenes]|nr:MBG domain-containing protein [Fibrobacter succinogenes]
MKNIKIFAFLAIFLLSAFVSSAWAVDVTLTYKISVTGTIPHAYITNADGETACDWANGIGVLWPANEGHTMNDGYGITFTPNQELDKTNKNEKGNKVSTAFSTEEKETDFQVKVGKEGFYLKSVTFKENNTVKASSPSNIAPNSTSIGVRVPANKFFNYITVVLTVDAYTVSVPENLTISDAFATISGVNYYKSGEKYTLTLSTTNANEIIDGITGVKATLEADKKSATFKMPSEDVTIMATTAEVYTVSVPENLTISDAFATISGVNYYKSGEKYTLTLSTTNANEIIDGITGVEATLEADKKSATFKMPSEDVTITATIASIVKEWDNGDGTKESPYKITSVEDLNTLAERVNAGNDFKGKYFKLTTDIEYSHKTKWENASSSTEHNFTPIGIYDDYSGYTYTFNGIFDGDGKTIRGIRINSDEYFSRVGLFGFLGGDAEVKNLRVADAVISAYEEVGTIAGHNEGKIRDCIVDSVLFKNVQRMCGGIAGYNQGTLSGNLVIRVTISTGSGYGAVAGINSSGRLSNNFYTACTFAGVENATNVGTADEKAFYQHQQVSYDVTDDNGAVSIHAVTLGEGISITSPKSPIYTDNDKNAYYMAGEICTITVANEDGIIEKITGVTASNENVTMNLAADKKSATFTMPSENVTITAEFPSTVVGYTVSVPGDLTISDAFATIEGVDYYKVGETYTLTAKENEIINTITGVTASNETVTIKLAADFKTATFEMPGEDVTITATTAEVYTVSVPENLTISDAFAIIEGVNYYKVGETYTLTAKENEIINTITGVTASNETVTINLAADKKSATFTMPSENVTITATTAEVYTVSVPENLTISDAFAIIEGVNYYKVGETYTLTLSNAKVNGFIDGITGVTATIAADRKSATFTMPSENVEMSASISKIWGGDDGRDGSKEHPYTIASVSELNELALVVNSGNDFKDMYFEVVEDIVYDVTQTDNGNNYTAIGDSKHPFNGKFNGNGHTISGIRIYKPNGYNQGLFGWLGEGAEVENVKLADVEITAEQVSGGIAGANDRGSIRNCTVEKSVKIVFTGNSFGGIVGNNTGTVSGCTSSATLISLGVSHDIGGIAGDNAAGGVLKDNLVIGAYVLTTSSRLGTIVGNNDEGTLNNNFYIACTVAGVENATNVGTGHGDVTENNGAVSIHAVTLGEGFSIVTPEKSIYTDNDRHNYYKAGETLTLEINFAGEKKTATFNMPNRDVEIAATASELHTVTVPEGFDISEPYLTIGGIKYYRLGETYTLTLTTAKIDEVIGEITGVTASIANDGKSATFTMPSENVEISATISKILWGGDDGRDGSKEHPYTIASAAELSVLALAVNSGNDFKDTYFEVVEDIVYDVTQTDNGNNYTAIGNEKLPFNGKFNGNGHTISGIRINKPKDYYQGLFGYLDEGAEVENVKVADVEITANHYAGGIAGESKGSIRNCTVEKSVKLAATGMDSRFFGGIAGVNGGTVSGCTSSATLTATGVDSRFFGGIVGDNGGTVSGCTSSATLTGSGYDREFGGIVGQNGGTVSGNTSSATLTTTGVDSRFFGGIVGHSWKGFISNNIAKNVTVSAPEYYGAVVGETENSKLENNFYTACTVNGVENATNVGVDGSDVTENYGAVGISFTEPAAVKDLVYNKLSHELVTAGKTNFGMLLYSLDGENYGTEIPTATDAKTYTVYYRVDKDGENVILPRTIKVSIAKIPLTVTAKNKIIVYGDEPANDGVEYSGFIGDETASVLGGKLTYSYNYKKLDKVGEYTITPSGLTSGNYEITYAAGTLTVKKADVSVEALAAKEKLVYNGKAQELVTAGKTNFGTLLYSLDGKKYSSEIPAATDAKTYTVYYKVEGSDNWNAYEAKKVEVKIAKADVSVDAPVAKEKLVYSGKSQELVTAGKTNFGTLLYSLDGKKYSSEIPTATDAKTYTVYYKVEGSDNWNAFEAKKVEVVIAKSTAIGHMNTRAARVIKVGADRTFDLKGRPVRGSSNARGAYYKK